MAEPSHDSEAFRQLCGCPHCLGLADFDLVGGRGARERLHGGRSRNPRHTSPHRFLERCVDGIFTGIEELNRKIEILEKKSCGDPRRFKNHRQAAAWMGTAADQVDASRGRRSDSGAADAAFAQDCVRG